MTPRDLLVDVFIASGVGCELVCCIGFVAMRSVFDRFHYAGAATTLGPVLVGIAIVIRESVSAGGLETIATVAILFLFNPVVLIATARAARRIDYGSVAPRVDELVE
jgi:monovalent cation/proton antiporter MnhG/PhaG subunit